MPVLLHNELAKTEAEFLGVIGTKVLRVFLLAIHSHLYKRILPPPPPPQSGWKLICNVKIVYGNNKSENSVKIMPGNLSEIVRS
jgi:hypothetical protein